MLVFLAWPSSFAAYLREHMAKAKYTTFYELNSSEVEALASSFVLRH
mgnify:CR=1 FL=1